MTLARIAFYLLAAAVLAIGCRDDDDDTEPTSTSEHTPTAAAVTAEPTISSEIRSLDLGATAPVQAIIDETGGIYVATDTLYGDLTEDRIEEAAAPISSGGSAGNVSVTVLTSAGGETVEELLRRDASAGGGLVAEIVDGKLMLTEPAPGPDDPECCPTQLRTTIYAWDGDSLEIESDVTSPNPQADSKTPASP